MKRIVLASSSPRRITLLSTIGIPFSYKKSSYSEIYDATISPYKLVQINAIGKAKDIAKSEEYAIVLGFDTVVVVKNQILGKPKTEKQAQKMLTLLSGTSHFVYTGAAIIDTDSKKSTTFSSKSKVFINKLSQKEIMYYVQTKEPLDKAGAYAIQGIGGMFINKIEGDYLSIVGFPLSRLYQTLIDTFNINLLSYLTKSKSSFNCEE